MEEKTSQIISANDVSNYVVCPEAWRLKYLAGGARRPSPRESTGQLLRTAWFKQQDLSARLRYYTKIAYALLVALVVVVFLLDQRQQMRRGVRRLPIQRPAVMEHR
jgi:hypothetical protein